MVRQATAEDLPRMGDAAREFYASSRFLKGFDLERFCAFWRQMMATETGVIFILEGRQGEIDGALGGLAYPEPYSVTAVATEMFWYVLEGKRGRGMSLYDAFEQWARERGCAQIRMVHLCDLMPDRLAWLYGELGFERIEVHYAKELR